jgi:hypothetical protein
LRYVGIDKDDLLAHPLGYSPGREVYYNMDADRVGVLMRQSFIHEVVKTIKAKSSVGNMMIWIIGIVGVVIVGYLIMNGGFGGSDVESMITTSSITSTLVGD